MSLNILERFGVVVEYDTFPNIIEQVCQDADDIPPGNVYSGLTQC